MSIKWVKESIVDYILVVGVEDHIIANKFSRRGTIRYVKKVLDDLLTHDSPIYPAFMVLATGGDICTTSKRCGQMLAYQIDFDGDEGRFYKSMETLLLRIAGLLPDEEMEKRLNLSSLVVES